MDAKLLNEKKKFMSRRGFMQITGGATAALAVGVAMFGCDNSYTPDPASTPFTPDTSEDPSGETMVPNGEMEGGVPADIVAVLSPEEQIALRRMRQRRMAHDRAGVWAGDELFNNQPDKIFGIIDNHFDCGHDYTQDMFANGR